MELSAEERAVLRGEHGKALRKAMDSVVTYGLAFDAHCLVKIEGAPHLMTSFGAGTMQPYFAMLDELISAGLRSEKAFTVDPGPVDYRNVRYSGADRLVLRLLYGKQKAYESQLAKLGLRDGDAFVCTCYLPEIGNTPRWDSVLAWSESSAVVFANSVLGARTNRNAAGIGTRWRLASSAARQRQPPNQRERRLEPKSSFSATRASDGAWKVPVGFGPERKSTLTRPTRPPPNST
jgi:predicted aconitase